MITIIRTCGKLGQKTLESLNNKENVFFWDNDCKKWGKKICEVDVLSFSTIKKLIKTNDYMLVIPSLWVIDNIIDEAREIGICESNMYVFSETIYNDRKELIPINEYVYLDYLEFHVTDHCNLNCKGCAVFSPLCNEAVYVDFELFKRDINKLKTLIPEIRRIRIMGGEPLLNPQLDKFIIETRRVYPYAIITIVTNGILLCRIKKELLNTIKEKNVNVFISCYPPMYEKAEEMITYLKENGVSCDCDYGYISQISGFYPILSDKKEFILGDTKKCICVNLRDGKMSSCALAMYGHYYNSFFNSNIPFDSGVIQLKECGTAKQLLDFLNQPHSICDYCKQYLWTLMSKSRKWEHYNVKDVPKEEDWF